MFGIPVCVLLVGAIMLYARRKTVSSFLQLLGAAGLLLVVLTHVAEAARLFPAMGWGRPHTVGHFADLGGAVIGLTLFPLGYLIQALRGR
jgi:hypothetical protein